ncbi:MAG: hypothetical protein AAF577_00290 [Pseudomonadota bacterium]
MAEELTRAEALALHRSGSLEQAAAAYDALIAAGPEDADLIGLRGIVAMQSGDGQGASLHLDRALSLGGDDAVLVRNLNARAIIEKDGDRLDAIPPLLAEHPLPVPLAPPGDTAAFGAYLSLASFALSFRDPERAALLANACLEGEAAADEAQRIRLATILAGLGLGRELQVLGDWVATRDRQDARKLWLEAWLAGQKVKRRDIVERARANVLREFPYHRDRRPGLDGDTLRVLVLRSPLTLIRPADPETNFGGNTIMSFAAMYTGTALAFDSFAFPGAESAVGVRPEPDADLVFNNLAMAEAAYGRGAQQQVEEMTAGMTVPVLNPPELVARTSRLEMGELLGGISGVRLPHTIMGKKGDTPLKAHANSIALEIGLPVIIRSVADHRGINMKLCKTIDETEAAIAKLPGDFYYAIEYLETRVSTSLWRKFRVAFIDGKPFGRRLTFGRDWMVHGRHWRAIAKDSPKLMQEEARFLADTSGFLGEPAMRALYEIRDRIKLDFFGIDFSFNRQGEMTIFEANAAMRVLPGRPEDKAKEFDHMVESRIAMHETFEAMLLRRAAEGRAARLAAEEGPLVLGDAAAPRTG